MHVFSRIIERPFFSLPISLSFSLSLSSYLSTYPSSLILPLRGPFLSNLVGVVEEGNLGTPDIQRQRLRPPRHRRKSRLMRLYRAGNPFIVQLAEKQVATSNDRHSAWFNLRKT